MERKTKYQYTYFIYPYLIEEKNYTKYLYRLLKKKNCKLKQFDTKKDIQIDRYFLPEIKEKLFWSMDLNTQASKSYETMDTKMKAKLLSEKTCNFFEYHLEEDIPGKIGEEEGIFFDITKVEIVCFQTGICFLLLKTVLNEGVNFSDVLNFNYKFRDIQSKIEHPKEYENIKIQTKKFNNMQTFSEFIEEIAGPNLQAKQINLDTDRLITYSYACLDQNSWNENTDAQSIEKDFEKFYYIKPAGAQINDRISQNEAIYQEKYMYYGFTNNSTVLLTAENNFNNYTNLLYQHENEELYHFIYHLYQKIYLKKLNYEFQKTKQFEKVKTKFLNFAKKDWIYEVTNDTKGVILEKYYRKEQNLEQTFTKLKNEYDLLFKEYEIGKNRKSNRYIFAIVSTLVILNLISLWLIFKY